MVAAAFFAVLAGVAFAAEAAQTDGKDLVGIYLACGCFWHVQHELIEAEKRILGRSGADLTAVVGYAGGSGVGSDGRVCYKGVLNDYARYGHTEVVYMEVPRNTVGEFAKVYWKLFVGKNRVDVQDVGAEYRAGIGIPGGVGSPFLAEFESAQEGNVAQPFTMRAGNGSDPDTLGVPLVYVYDETKFPFYLGEVYHQFHDDMVEKYDAPYHALKGVFLEKGTLAPTGCWRDGDGTGTQRVGGYVAGSTTEAQAEGTTRAPIEQPASFATCVYSKTSLAVALMSLLVCLL